MPGPGTGPRRGAAV